MLTTLHLLLRPFAAPDAPHPMALADNYEVAENTRQA